MLVKNLLKKEGTASFFSAVAAVVMGLLVGLIVLLFASPANAFAGFRMILTGGLADMKSLGQVLYYATPIIMTGLSVAFANKTGLFNIGGAGQYMVGSFAAVYVGVEWTFLPPILHCFVAIIAAALAGAIWGLIPGLMKAYCNVNEVISCIMMNYIGLNLVNLLVRQTVFDSTRNQSYWPADSAELPKLGFDKIFVAGATPSSVNSGIIIAILLGIAVYIVVNSTRFGYELKACGLNREAARYAGINEKKSIVLSMVIAGALAGLGGALYYLSGAGASIAITEELAAEGFNGIPVALLGMSNPIGAIFAGIFISYLKVGGQAMQSLGLAPQIIDIITSVIIYFAAFALFFKLLLAKLTASKQTENANSQPTAQKSQKGGTA